MAPSKSLLEGSASASERPSRSRALLECEGASAREEGSQAPSDVCLKLERLIHGAPLSPPNGEPVAVLKKPEMRMSALGNFSSSNDSTDGAVSAVDLHGKILGKCKDFIPKLRAANERLQDQTYRDHVHMESANQDQDCDGKPRIELDLHLGVFNTNQEIPSDERLREMGITPVDKHVELSDDLPGVCLPEDIISAGRGAGAMSSPERDTAEFPSTEPPESVGTTTLIEEIGTDMA
eukprot:GHVT01079398.1.p1 GENE.GHVT01079398.1~~GHVT01079398.1.p1  ORF type:complete len:236 (+),score=40.70 GHVT01079398.1:210-917(+)